MNEERKLLLDTAAALLAEMRKITGPVNEAINRLIESSDEEKVSDADTMQAAKGVITRKLKIKALASKVKPKSAAEALGEVDASLSKPKRKMPPLTPEQKAKRVESLKKARAAKKGAQQ